MVEWTDAERAAITSLWGKIDVGEIGPQALARLLIVYPWTQRHFGAFGNISTNAAILGNQKVADHGKIVMGGLERAVKNLDNIKEVYKTLSVKHSDIIHVDPDNFRLLAEIITICVGAKFGSAGINPDAQAAWQKFLSAVVSALGRQYH
ncbi:hemoglobin subunit beta [Larimichthys crocea]|uniref:hemoglobin subunit beta n=1 Tax=Larimichthys crocea TaxID=215358 RepID=UPI00054C66A5|nr:hemoglobin subunit beta [Larimichthys crocea]